MSNNIDLFEDIFKNLEQLEPPRKTSPINLDIKKIKTSPVSESMDEVMTNSYKEHTKITHEAIRKELDSKGKYRAILIIILLSYLILVTIAVLLMLEWNVRNGRTILTEKVELSLISGIFVNLLGLVILVFRYAFSSTNEILKHSKDVLISLNKQSEK